jgi:hypothetical protein
MDDQQQPESQLARHCSPGRSQERARRLSFVCRSSALVGVSDAHHPSRCRRTPATLGKYSSQISLLGSRAIRGLTAPSAGSILKCKLSTRGVRFPGLKADYAHRHHNRTLGALAMPIQCQFVPPYILEHLTRVDARNSLEPSAAQRSAVVSAQIRRARSNLSPAVQGPAGAVPTKKGIAKGLQFPPPASAGRLIYDDLNQWNFDVQFIRGEGDPAVPGQNADLAYDYLGIVRKYYKDVLGRDSIDNAGLNLIANVNFGVSFDNAFWDGVRMVFGNGSNVVFTDLTGDLDVPAHELTHGVTQYTAGLNYSDDQSGALNESFSDMLASAIDASANNRDADTHNWLIGEEIMAASLAGEALRNMAEPGTAYDNPLMGRDPQPRDMSGYFEPADPHLMSGIPNRWFYLICKEIGIPAGTLIMYQTLQNLWPTAVFADAAQVASAQARILATAGQVPPESTQVVRAAARQQGFW